VNWLRRRFRTRRGYLRYLVRAQYVGWGLNVVFLVFALVAAFGSKLLNLPQDVEQIMRWTSIVGFTASGFVLNALSKAHRRVFEENL
jgi:hypothetical protein